MTRTLPVGAFFDTNIPLYLLSADAGKASRAEDLLAERGTISVQVLNEFAAVARRKHATPWPDVVLDIVLPPATTGKARALYEQMARDLAFDPRAGGEGGQ